MGANLKKLQTYISSNRQLLIQLNDLQGFQGLVETQWYAGDYAGAINTARLIEDAENRWNILSRIFSEAVSEKQVVDRVWAFLESERLTDLHVDVMDMMLDDPAINTEKLYRLIGQCAPDSIVMQSLIWSQLAKRGFIIEAIHFFTSHSLPQFMENDWHADVAVGLARQSDYVEAAAHLAKLHPFYRAPALLSLIHI